MTDLFRVVRADKGAVLVLPADGLDGAHEPHRVTLDRDGLLATEDGDRLAPTVGDWLLRRRHRSEPAASHHGPGPRQRGRHVPGPGARRQHRRRARGRAPRAGPGPRPRRAAAHAGLALGCDPRRRPDQGRPRPGPRRHDRGGRGGGPRGRRPHGQRPHRPGPRRAPGTARPGRHPRRRRPVGRGQVHPGQRARRPGRHGDGRAPGRRARSAHDDAPRAGPAGGRRDAHRHARHPRGRRRGGRRTRWTRPSRTSPSWPAACRFADCHHAGEPGCAIQAALDSGELAERRFDSWRRLAREAAYQARRSDARLRAEERDRWKKVTKEYQRGLRGPGRPRP